MMLNVFLPSLTASIVYFFYSGEKQSFITFQTTSSEVEQLQRFSVALDYHSCERIIEEADEEHKRVHDEIQVQTHTLHEKQQEVVDADMKMKQIQSELEEELSAELQSLKASEEDLSKSLVKVTTTVNNHQQTLQGEKDAAASLARQVETTTQELSAKKVELSACLEDVTVKESGALKADQEATAARERYQNACAGVVDGDSSADVLSLPEQVATWEKRAREAQSQLQQVRSIWH
jgi:structural maintenance of chromosome 2